MEALVMRWYIVFFGILLTAGCTNPSPAVTDPRAVLPSSTASPPASPAAAHFTETAPAARFALPAPGSASWETVLTGFSRPIALTHADDERVFVAEQRGVIWSIDWTLDDPQVFLDIREAVNDSANEQGLLGLVFHPAFKDNDRFFVNYTADKGETIIAEYQAGTIQTDGIPAMEKGLLQIDQPYANHNGGALVFGLDGYLYIGTGDGGSRGDPLGNGQRLDTLLGKILRIDVDEGEPYAIPEDNPFVGSVGKPEIWLYGLRNPWRIAFDAATGDLFIGDVGQDQWEEIDYLPAGHSGGINYGWNLREGAHTFSGGEINALVDPVAEYDHNLGCSVTGGVVVRDPRLPTWQGTYLYGDYCSGRIWGLIQDDRGTWLNSLLFETDHRISAFGEDQAGRLYLLDHNGDVLRLEPAP
jgi:glucose/arabinose dehydrogenase